MPRKSTRTFFFWRCLNLKGNINEINISIMNEQWYLLKQDKNCAGGGEGGGLTHRCNLSRHDYFLCLLSFLFSLPCLLFFSPSNFLLLLSTDPLELLLSFSFFSLYSFPFFPFTAFLFHLAALTLTKLVLKTEKKLHSLKVLFLSIVLLHLT